MKSYGGIALLFLTWTLDGGSPAALSPREGAPGIHWIVGWLGPHTHLEAVEKWKTCLFRESNSSLPARSLVPIAPSINTYPRERRNVTLIWGSHFNIHLERKFFIYERKGFSFFHGVRLSPLGIAATGLLHQPQMINDSHCGAMGGMRIGRGNRNTRRKPAPVPLCPPQLPHYLTRARTRAAAEGSRRLTAWAMARPKGKSVRNSFSIFRSCVLPNILIIYPPSRIFNWLPR
jgi:hypothetical protein